jgi:hypothetical protein
MPDELTLSRPVPVIEGARVNYPAHLPGRDARIFVSCAGLTALLAWFGYLYPELAAAGHAAERVIGFVLLMIATVVVIWQCVRADGAANASLTFPAALYPVLYGLYFLIPYGLLITDATAPSERFPQLGLAILVGLVSFLCGCACAQRRGTAAGVAASEASAAALFVTSWIGILLVVAFWRYRISIGQFYTHAQEYVVGTDATASFFENFAIDLQLPVVLLLALTAQLHSRWARRARVTLSLYAAALLAIYVMASMFRSALTVLIFAVLGAQFGGVLRPKQVVQIGLIGVAALFVVFVVRAANIGDELVGSRNQLRDVAAAVREGRIFSAEAIGSVFGSGDRRSDVSGRATLPLTFIQEIMAQTDAGYPFGWGRTIRHETSEAIPRLFWPNKPVFMSTQRLIRDRLNLSDTDNSPNAIAQGYFELGWFGVAGLHFMMGVLIAGIAARARTVSSYFLLFFMWTAYSMVDAGIYMNILVQLRTCALVFVMFCVVRFIVSWGQRIPTAAPVPR